MNRMADDVMSSAMSTGLAVISGGGVSGVMVRIIFGGFAKRLDEIEKTLKELGDKVDARHEKLIERLTTVEAQAQAAHRRLDEIGRRRK